MIWLFIGVAIVSDKFMESIETITGNYFLTFFCQKVPEIYIFCMFSAQEKEVTIKDPRTGKNQVVVVKVWNETVANLTLMALGSSAPEIMLSVIEIWAKGFQVSLIYFYLISGAPVGMWTWGRVHTKFWQPP